MAKIQKDIFATKLNRAKIIQLLNLLYEFNNEKKTFLIKDNTLYTLDDFFQVLLITDILFTVDSNYKLLEYNDELKQLIENATDSFNIKEIIDHKVWVQNESIPFLNAHKDRIDFFKIDNNETPLVTALCKDELIKEVDNFIDSVNNGYGSFNISDNEQSYDTVNEKLILSSNKFNYTFNNKDIINKFTFYIPYEIFKNINKVSNLVVNLYDRCSIGYKGDLLSINFTYNKLFNLNIKSLIIRQ